MGNPLASSNSWDGADLAVIVETVRRGDAPGTIATIDWDTQDPPAGSPHHDHGSHSLGILEAIALGRALERMPRHLRLVGIEPLDLGWGEGLSDPVAGSVDAAARLVLDYLRSLTSRADRRTQRLAPRGTRAPTSRAGHRSGMSRSSRRAMPSSTATRATAEATRTDSARTSSIAGITDAPGADSVHHLGHAVRGREQHTVADGSRPRDDGAEAQAREDERVVGLTDGVRGAAVHHRLKWAPGGDRALSRRSRR